MGNSSSQESRPYILCEYEQHIRRSDTDLIWGLLIAIKFKEKLIVSHEFWEQFIEEPDGFHFDHAIASIQFKNASSKDTILDEFQNSLKGTIRQSLASSIGTQPFVNDEFRSDAFELIIAKLNDQQFITWLRDILASYSGVHLTHHSSMPIYLRFDSCIQDTFIRFELKGSIHFDISAISGCKFDTKIKLDMYLTNFKNACEIVMSHAKEASAEAEPDKAEPTE